MSDCKIKRALISVYDKTGVVEFARALVSEFGVEIISTGGTASLLKKEGIPVTLVEEVTGFPEMMDGRVKTLHPKIHAGILADRDNPEHMRQLAEQGIKPIDMVVVNLYPFEKTIADPDCTFEQAIEMIDIGGPCMLRAAAKNHRQVWVIDQPHLYESAIRTLGLGKPEDLDDQKDSGAFGAFNRTCMYDAAVSSWLGRQGSNDGSDFVRHMHLLNWGRLRYGENPHQNAELLRFWDATTGIDLTTADVVEDEPAQAELSFNNYVDANAALGLCAELSRSLTAGLRGTGAGRDAGGESGAGGQCGTGFQPVKCASGFQPDDEKGSLRPIENESHTIRNLPHIQSPGKAYFVTFRLRQERELAPSERDIVIGACLHWHKQKMDLHSVVVMPDHVHLLLTPRETQAGQWVSLGEILHSVKRFSSREINLLRGRTGALWLDESFDRIMRNERELLEKMEYIRLNPVKKGLAEEGKYPWYWDDTMPIPDREQEEDGDHRLETGGTPSQATPSQATPSGATLPGTGHCCVFIKHTNACGVGLAGSPVEAYRQAYLGDPNAAMGGILACDYPVTADFAEAVMETYARWGKAAGAAGFFVEVWVAPGFDDEAIKCIRTKKKWGERVRLLAVGDMTVAPDADELDYKKISGGMLLQSRDLVGLNEDQWKVVTKRQPTDAEMADLRLAWLVCKHTKSNAITISKDGTLVGNGAGQMSRVMSCRIATWLAKENGHEGQLAGSVAASDAFFPFPDGPNILIDAGVSAIIQPGGSKRDQDTTAACDERDVAMIHTGTRHFKH